MKQAIKVLRSLKLYGQRCQRSRCSYEFHRYQGCGFFNVTVGNPDKHCWWAFSVYLQFEY